MRVIALVVVCYLALLSQAEGRHPVRSKPPFLPTKGLELAGAVNLPEKNLKLVGGLFLPDSATRIRAVLVIMKHGPTEALLLTGENPYSVWHSTAESLSCALLHLRVTPIRAPEPGPTPPETEPMQNAAAVWRGGVADSDAAVCA